MDRLVLQRWAAGVSILAGLIHGLVTPEHLEVWWGYGLFFLAAALAQAMFGVALLQKWWTRPGGDPARDEDRLYLAGILGNGAIILLYLVSRTVGVPFFGPESGEVESVSPISAVSKALEVALIGLLVVLLRSGDRASIRA